MNQEYTLNRLENLLYRARERRYYHDSRAAKLDAAGNYEGGLKHWQKARDEEKEVRVFQQAIDIAKSPLYVLAIQLMEVYHEETKHQNWDRDGCIWAGWYELYAGLGMKHDAFNYAFRDLLLAGFVAIADNRVGLPADGLGYNKNRDYQQLMLAFYTDHSFLISKARKELQ